MKKTLYVAGREFAATVMTKGFVFGVLITPALIAVVIYFMPRMMNRTPPRIEGRVAIVDATGQVAERFRPHVTPAAFAEARDEDRRQIRGADGGRAEGRVRHAGRRRGSGAVRERGTRRGAADRAGGAAG